MSNINYVEGAKTENPARIQHSQVRSRRKIVDIKSSRANGTYVHDHQRASDIRAQEKADDLKGFIHMIATALVEDPGSVEVSEIVGSKSRIYGLKVAKSDLGKIIGRNGRIADAIRTLLEVANSHNLNKAVLEIIE